MSSILKVDTIQDQSGNNIINENADTITIGASGDTVNIVGTLQNNGAAFAQGITEADQWHTNANQSGTFFTLINWERLDYGTTLPLGTGMTQSSGIFTFPSTGYYRVFCHASMTRSSTSYYAGIELLGTNNNSSYIRMAESLSNIPATASVSANASCEVIFKVSNTSNDKVKMNTQAQATTTYAGNANYAATSITFIKLAEI